MVRVSTTLLQKAAVAVTAHLVTLRDWPERTSVDADFSRSMSLLCVILMRRFVGQCSRVMRHCSLECSCA